MFDQVDAMRTLLRLLNIKDLDKIDQNQNSEASELYFKGITALKKQNFKEAIESWIPVLTLDRKLDNDGARKACVSLFKLLDQHHDLTQKYHRQFTSALF